MNQGLQSVSPRRHPCNIRVIHSGSLLLLFSLLGCQAEPLPQPQPAAAPVIQETAELPAVNNEITLAVVDKDGYQKVIDSKRGQIVLVDAWATWCGPCKQAFPHNVALHEKYSPRGLAVVSLSLDDDDAHQQALDFLVEQKARFTHLRSKMGAKDVAFEQFEIDGGSLPHLKLYDREGNLVKKFISGDPDNAFTPEDVDLAIRKLIADK